jgi:hypothetical protein
MEVQVLTFSGMLHSSYHALCPLLPAVATDRVYQYTNVQPDL